MDTHPIGIFDSGSGGLSILLSLKDLLPQEAYVYIGDHKHLPYGEKPVEFVQSRAISCIKFLLDQQVKVIVVACNTATVAGIHIYRERFPHVPIIGVVPVIKTAASVTKSKRILILSTVATANSLYQKDLIQTFAPGCEVFSVGNSTLVTLVESGKSDSHEAKELLESIIVPYISRHIDTIVLGCTHFPFMKPLIQDIVGGGISILDSGAAVARQTKRILEQEHILSEKKGKDAFYTTGDQQIVSGVYSALLKEPVSAISVQV